MNNKQQAENFLNLAKEAMNSSDREFAKRIKIAQVHATLALEEAVRGLDAGS